MREERKIGILAVILSVIVISAGCSDKVPARETGTDQENSLYEDRMEISVALWGIDDALSHKENDQFYEHLSERFNIELKPVPINWDDYTQKIILWASTGDLPDIFSIDAIGTSYYRDWIKRKLIKSLPDDLSRFPNLEKYLAEADIENLKVNGKLYFVPRRLYDSIKYCVHDRNIFYRWDLAQKAGINKEPETWEEFSSMLDAIIKNDPENRNIQGLTFVNMKHISGLFWLYSNPAAASDGSGNDYKWIKENGKYIPAVFSEKSLPSLINLRNMYVNGLTDREAVSAKGTQGYEKFAEGKAAAILIKGYGNLDTFVLKKWKEIYPDKELTECVKRARNFPAVDGNKYQCVFKTFWSESYFNNEMSDEKFSRILDLYDYMLSEEAKEFYRFGVKGVDYIKEGNRIIPITNSEDLKKKQHSGPVLSSLVEYDDQFQYDPNNYTLDLKIREMASSDIATDMAETVIPEYEDSLTYLSTPSKDVFAIYDYDDMIRVMISEKPVEVVWNEIIEGYRKKGLDKVIEEVNNIMDDPG